MVLFIYLITDNFVVSIQNETIYVQHAPNKRFDKRFLFYKERKKRFF
jgi:hypothetical protein